MYRIPRLLPILLLAALLGACGAKGDLVKPAAADPAENTPASE
ncbi:hypothetical protein [Dokdonella sp.]